MCEVDTLILLQRQISESVVNILPHLEESDADGIAEYLTDKGVQKLDDLSLITTSILESKLSFIDSARLVQEWSKKSGAKKSVLTSQQQNSSSSSSRSKPKATPKNLAEAAESVISNLPQFDSKSPYIPSAVKVAMNSGKRPLPKDLDEMASRVVDHCREVVPNLERKKLDGVADQLVRCYPKTFKDSLPVSDKGSEGLRKKLKIKLDNDKRPERRTAKEKASPGTKAAFGCENWNPPMPDDETEDSQLEHRESLKTIHGTSKRDWDWRTIKELMDKSYYSQRKQINEETMKKKKRNDDQDEPLLSPIPGIAEEWPFIFTSKGMNVHFMKLTNVDFREQLESHVKDEAKSIINCLCTVNEDLARIKRKTERAVDRGYKDAYLAGMVRSLMLYFKEEKNALFSFIEDTASMETARLSANFPEDHSPHLIIAGKDVFNAQRVFLAVDDHVVTGSQSLFDMFCAMFMSYYIFNILYSARLGATLTYVQRAIAKINPTKGNRATTCVVQKKASEKVTKFSNRLAVFKQRMEEEENNSP